MSKAPSESSEKRKRALEQARTSRRSSGTGRGAASRLMRDSSESACTGSSPVDAVHLGHHRVDRGLRRRSASSLHSSTRIAVPMMASSRRYQPPLPLANLRTGSIAGPTAVDLVHATLDGRPGAGPKPSRRARALDTGGPCSGIRSTPQWHVSRCGTTAPARSLAARGASLRFAAWRERQQLAFDRYLITRRNTNDAAIGRLWRPPEPNACRSDRWHRRLVRPPCPSWRQGQSARRTIRVSARPESSHGVVEARFDLRRGCCRHRLQRLCADIGSARPVCRRRDPADGPADAARCPRAARASSTRAARMASRPT